MDEGEGRARGQPEARGAKQLDRWPPSRGRGSLTVLAGAGALGGCITAGGACAWSAHGYKHFPFAKMTRADTAPPNEARYLDRGTVEALETATAQAAFRRTVSPAGKAQYLRDVGGVIGWDEGCDATLSYVECSGGTNAGRSYHGRPMHAGSAKRP